MTADKRWLLCSFWQLSGVEYADRIANDFPEIPFAVLERIGERIGAFVHGALEDACELNTPSEQVEAEREECAKIADDKAAESCIDPYCCEPLAKEIAAAIRARCEKGG